MPRTGHDFFFDETVLDPHSETRMATIFLYKRAPDEFFWHAHSPPAGGGRGYACVGGREEARLRRAVAAEREGMGIGLHRTTIGQYV